VKPDRGVHYIAGKPSNLEAAILTGKSLIAVFLKRDAGGDIQAAILLSSSVEAPVIIQIFDFETFASFIKGSFQ
jgi:hypothetical protein